jgi:hypothetical protein
VNFLPGVQAALREFRRPGLWLGIWWFGWLLCITLSLIHAPNIDLNLPEGDKIGHFFAYGTLSAWSILIFARPRNHWHAALSLVALGVAMELAQGAFTSYRMMDAKDGVADAIGVAAGQLLALSRARGWLQRWDARLFD